eukprot:6209592-Pleurochrysis_carterae.AAC.2
MATRAHSAKFLVRRDAPCYACGRTCLCGSGVAAGLCGALVASLMPFGGMAAPAVAATEAACAILRTHRDTEYSRRCARVRHTDSVLAPHRKCEWSASARSRLGLLVAR